MATVLPKEDGYAAGDAAPDGEDASGRHARIEVMCRNDAALDAARA
jgi:hypothetical protein